MILAVMNTIYAIAYIEAWKIQDFKRVWTRDLAIIFAAYDVWYGEDMRERPICKHFNWRLSWLLSQQMNISDK